MKIYRKTCPSCGRQHIRESKSELLFLRSCEACAASLPPYVEEYEPEASSTVTPNEEQTIGEDETQPKLPVENIAEYELVLSGASVVIGLPIPMEGQTGFVGRRYISSKAIREFGAISRDQFTYEYLSDGTIRITDRSQFGTYADDVRLEPGDSAILTEGSRVRMGGRYDFVLRKRGGA